MHRVVVYGTLRTGERNWSWSLAPQKGVEITLIGYKMHRLGGFPGIYRTDNAEDTIVAELFEVDDETLSRLDRLEGYTEGLPPTFYNREELWSEDEGEEKIATYIYTYVNVEHLKECPEVPFGDWVNGYKRAKEQSE